MSLAARLLLLIVLLNAAVVGAVQLVLLYGQRQADVAQRELYRSLLFKLLEDAYPSEDIGVGWVRELLGVDSFRGVFRDVLVVSSGFAGTVDLNPMGAAHRRSAEFPRADIEAGIAEALRRQAAGRVEPVEAGGGFCLAVPTRGAESAAAWYVPLQSPSSLRLAWFALPVLLATALTALLGFWMLRRFVGRPLDGLGAAAARVGAGDAGVRVERVSGARELNAVVDAFNVMAQKVAGHTDELRREVQRATEEAARRERALVQSSRLAAMGTLAAGIAHEINNPIGGMMNAVHRLRQREGLDERSRVYLDLVLEGLERVGAITRRVLDFSPRQIEAAPFPLVEAVEAALSLVKHRIDRQQVAVSSAVPAELYAIGDRHEIQQVVLNCFLNSLDALGGQSPPCTLRVRGWSEGANVALEVEDNGPGADAETVQRVFDPFFSAKDRPDASGLGLFISYSIIRNHGGELRVNSRPGEGFTVRLVLPAAPPPELLDRRGGEV